MTINSNICGVHVKLIIRKLRDNIKKKGNDYEKGLGILKHWDDR